MGRLQHGRYHYPQSLRGAIRTPFGKAVNRTWPTFAAGAFGEAGEVHGGRVPIGGEGLRRGGKGRKRGGRLCGFGRVHGWLSKWTMKPAIASCVLMSAAA